MKRREFSKLSALGLAAAALPGSARGAFRPPVEASPLPPAAPEQTSRGAWFTEARFGCFIHFGLYALLGRCEWAMFLERIPPEEYAKLKDRFNPTEFNAKEWIDLAKAAGQRYITLTAKHHEGFALFDTKLSDFSVMHTPFGRDICGELAEECHRQGMVVNFYFSLMDWYSPLYQPRSLKYGTPVSREFIAFAHGQVRELCTNYGKLGVVWFDGGWDHTPEQWQSQKLVDMIHKLQPDALINNRAGLPGDFTTPEAGIGMMNPPKRLSEHVMTISDHWGYDSRDQRFKSAPMIIQLLVTAVARGANLCLNVGPLPSGKIDAMSAERLNATGEWLRKNGESIYGATSFRLLPQRSYHRKRRQGLCPRL